MVTRKNHLNTDAIREIRGTMNRYLSILVLAALAVAFLSGLRTAAPDMQYTADNYYDRTHLMDGYVLSTLGLTDGDLDALAASGGVGEVEGCRDLDAIATDRIVNVRSLPEKLNLLEVKEGRLPQAADECVTESLLMVKLGLQVGDRLELALEEDNVDDLARTSYTIVGVVNSPLYVSLDRGASSLGSGSVDAFVYVPGENFTFEHYTCAYFTGEGLAVLDTYGDEYEDKIDALVDSLDPLAQERSQLRYDELIGDAQEELDDARKELEDAKAEAEQELADAWRELQDGRKELDDGWADYRDGGDTLARRGPPWPTCAGARPTWPTDGRSMRTGWHSISMGWHSIKAGWHNTGTVWHNMRRPPPPWTGRRPSWTRAGNSITPPSSPTRARRSTA